VNPRLRVHPRSRGGGVDFLGLIPSRANTIHTIGEREQTEKEYRGEERRREREREGWTESNGD